MANLEIESVAPALPTAPFLIKMSKTEKASHRSDSLFLGVGLHPYDRNIETLDDEIPF